MGRFNGNSSYGHDVVKIDENDYKCYWMKDSYYSGNPLRFPKQHVKHVDKKGALRFCKRHNIEMPA